MNFGIFLFLVILNFCLGLTRRRSNIILLVSMAFLIFLVATNSDRNDYIMYSTQYNNMQGNISTEIGFAYILRVFNQIGADFNTFVVIIYCVCYILIYLGLRKFVKNFHLILALYAVTGMFPDFIQMRNFISMSIVIFCIQFLVPKNRNIILYVIGVLLASSIHLSSAFYLLFVGVTLQNKTLFRRFLIGISIAFAIFSLFSRDLINVFYALIQANSNDVRVEYYSSIDYNNEFIIYWFLLAVNCLLMYTSSKYWRRYGCEDEQVDSIVSIITNINICTLVLLPLIITNINIYRLFRNLLIINAALVEILLQSTFSGKEYRAVLKKSYAQYMVKAILVFAIWWLLVDYRWNSLMLDPFLK